MSPARHRFELASILFVMSCSACASLPVEDTTDTSLVRIAGSVRYEDTVPLPQGVTLRVALHDLGRPDGWQRVVAYQDTWPGRLGPYAFLLQLDRSLLDPDHTYGLSAQIFDSEARLVWTTGRVQPVSTESPGTVTILVRRVEEKPMAETTPTPPTSPIATSTGDRTLSFDCEGLAVTVHVEEERVRLVLPDREIVLARVQGAAGQEYGNPGARVRLRGEALFLELSGKVYRTCEPQGPGS